MATSQKMLVEITKSIETMPRQMREVCKVLQTKCTEKFSDSRYTSVGEYLFYYLN